MNVSTVVRERHEVLDVGQRTASPHLHRGQDLLVSAPAVRERPHRAGRTCRAGGVTALPDQLKVTLHFVGRKRNWPADAFIRRPRSC